MLSYFLCKQLYEIGGLVLRTAHTAWGCARLDWVYHIRYISRTAVILALCVRVIRSDTGMQGATVYMYDYTPCTNCVHLMLFFRAVLQGKQTSSRLRRGAFSSNGRRYQRKVLYSTAGTATKGELISFYFLMCCMVD